MRPQASLPETSDTGVSENGTKDINLSEERDLEAGRNASLVRHLTNDSVQSFSWSNITVTVKDRKTKQPLPILSSSYGHVEAGQLVALMGPSGSGKTTLLNALAHRVTASGASVDGKVMVNGHQIGQSKLQELSSYVEQEDALIGSLTVRETVDFAARLAMPGEISTKERRIRVNELIDSFGLQRQANTIVGTAIQKGISGGQKRRLSVASQLVTSPSILFLDEPTSGLDSAAAREVMSYIATVAKQHRITVIASIHQPSTATFELFDQVLLLSKGKTCFSGARGTIQNYFQSIGRPIPLHTNPAEFLLDLVNTDFARDRDHAEQDLSVIQDAWNSSADRVTLFEIMPASTPSHEEKQHRPLPFVSPTRQKKMAPLIILHRNFIKSYRDVLAYGTRIFMYFGLAIMMGTTFLRLPYHQSSIQPFTNAIFFGGAFLSFMAVSYIPPAVEDLHTFRKDRANGLYGPFTFVIANFLIGMPYLFLISVLFSIITYWLSNFHNTATNFCMWVMWLFLDLLAAEGLVMLVTSIAPIFVVALAITAFANGLWMCVDGFLVPMGQLNVFWKYVFHYIDYQAYVFQGMMVNQFRDTIYKCDEAGCMYPSELQSLGKIDGKAVLKAYHYGYSDGEVGKWVGIMIGIIIMYRVLGYLVLVLKRN